VNVIFWLVEILDLDLQSKPRLRQQVV
jgi:hypothetical protein